MAPRIRFPARIHPRRGFTLIEVLVVMVIVGIMVAVAGMGIVAGTRGYLVAVENAHKGQKAQLAMARLTREMRAVSDVVTETFSDAGTVDRYLVYDSLEGRHAVARAGAQVLLYDLSPLATTPAGTGYPLVDGLGARDDALDIRFYDRQGGQWLPGVDAVRELVRIDLALYLSGADAQAADLAFTSSVYPRSR